VVATRGLVVEAQNKLLRRQKTIIMTYGTTSGAFEMSSQIANGRNYCWFEEKYVMLDMSPGLLCRRLGC